MGLAGYGPVPEPGYYFKIYAIEMEGKWNRTVAGDRAARRRGGGEAGVFDGNEGRSAGATMPEERGMPGGNAGDVSLVRGGGGGATERASAAKPLSLLVL